MEIGGMASQAMAMQRAVSGQSLALASMKMSLQTDQAAAQLLAGAAAPQVMAVASGSVGANLDIRV